jgi:multiple sugar transport system ATP-binding protein
VFLELNRLTKRFGNVTALDNLSLQIREGEFFAILGRSAAGKTTALRTICGLEAPDGGRIVFDGQDITDASPQSRGIAMIFQSFALYPHLTVRDNLAYPLREAGMKKPDITRRIGETAEMLSISHTLERQPDTLIGGEQQRVAIGRALIRRPRVLLLDEPLTNLDAKLRNEMRVEFKRLHRELGMTMIYATPDQLEAVTMAERIAVIDEGRIIGSGTSRSLYHRPPNARVARLVGSPAMNLVAGRWRKTGAGHSEVKLPFVTVTASEEWGGHIGDLEDGQPVFIGLRPHDLKPAGAHASQNRFEGEIQLIEPLGDVTIVDIKAGDVPLKMVVGEASAAGFQPGKRIVMEFNPDSASLFHMETGERVN